MNARILVVECDRSWQSKLGNFLEKNGLTPSFDHDPKRLISRIEREMPSLVLLRDGLPEITAAAILRSLRDAGHETPVIVIGETTCAIKRSICLELGADDYVGARCDLRELLSRIRNVLRYRPAHRRVEQLAKESKYGFGDFVLDLQSGSLTCNGVRVALPGTLSVLLKLFAKSPMRVLSRATIASTLRGPTSDICERSLDVSILRLRRILECDPARPRYIQTVRGRGYVFSPQGNIQRTI